jgi:hypothetical protein
VPKYSMRASISPRRYASHVALVSSICEACNCFEEERCDANSPSSNLCLSSTTLKFDKKSTTTKIGNKIRH